MTAEAATGGPSTSGLDETRYADIDRVLDNRGPWTDEAFVGGQQVGLFTQRRNEVILLTNQAKDALRRGVKILVIGAGGLGCEILQNLALSESVLAVFNLEFR